MVCNGKKRLITVSIAALLILASVLSVCGVQASADEKSSGTGSNVVRVGYPIQEGLTEINKNGEYTGYTYEYLMKMAQFTGWKYEFVRVDGDLDHQLSTMLDMLGSGEIDIMGCMSYDESLEEYFDFATVPYGSGSYALCVLNENSNLNSYNYGTVEKIRVAQIKTAEQANSTLEKFAEMCGFEIESVFCNGDNEQILALENGLADAMLSIDLSIPTQKVHSIARFMPRPFFFATTKGKTHITSEINMALTMIEETNPLFMTTMHNKYFGEEKFNIEISETDKQYARNLPELHVAMLGGRAPIQYFDDNTRGARGVNCDVLERIGQLTGLRFTYTVYDDEDALISDLESGNVDLVAGLDNNVTIYNTYGCTLTMPYMSVPLATIVHDSIEGESLNGKRLALNESVIYTGEYRGTVERFTSVQDCLRAVDAGHADYTYANSYTAQYYIKEYGYKHLVQITQQENRTQNFCLGLTKNQDMRLLNLLNRAIFSIDDEEIEMLIYRNADINRPVTLLSYIQANKWQALLISLLTVAAVFLIVLYLHLRNMKLMGNRLTIAYDRYQQLSDFSNEYLFEYDVKKDKLILSEKSAGLFKCERNVHGFSVFVKANEAQSNDKEPIEFYRVVCALKSGAHEFSCMMPDGKSHWLRVLMKVIDDSSGAHEYCVGKVADIDETRRRELMLEQRSCTDGLTGLLNAAASRNAIGLRLEHESGPAAFLILDIDMFKSINDTYGHYTGDVVLASLAKIMRDVMQSAAIIGRLGGDEFAAFIFPQTKHEIEQKCKTLLLHVARIKSNNMEPGTVTLSVGVAMARPGDTFDTIYQRADNVLYRVKKSGRNGYLIED